MIACDPPSLLCTGADWKDRVPLHASTLYSRNVLALLEEVVKDGALALDLADDLVGPTLATHAGEARHRLVRATLGLPAEPAKGAAS